MKNIKNILNNMQESDYYCNADFHIHSIYSDGKLTPREILNQAEKKGLKYISICDHNTLKAYQDEGISKNTLIIPGVEFDSWHKGVLIHILGLGVDFNNCELKSICASTKAGTGVDIVRFFSSIKRKPEKVIDIIHKSKGVAILAHPACCWALDIDKFIKSLLDMGLDGLEVYYPYKRHRGIIKFHKSSTIKYISEKYKVLKTGGSDNHSKKI